MKKNTSWLLSFGFIKEFFFNMHIFFSEHQHKRNFLTSENSIRFSYTSIHIFCYDCTEKCQHAAPQALALTWLARSLLMTSSCRSSFAQRDSAAARLVINTVDEDAPYQDSMLTMIPAHSLLLAHAPWLQLGEPLVSCSMSVGSFRGVCVILSLCRCACDTSLLMLCKLSSACHFSRSSLLIFSWRFLSADRIAADAQGVHVRDHAQIIGRVTWYNISFLAVGEIRDRNVV